MLKVIVVIAVVLIVSTVIFAMPQNVPDLIWTVIKVSVGIVIIVLIFKGIQAALQPKPFSPTESFRKKIIHLAERCKPFNVKNLFLRGEDMRVYSKWGKITGLLFIPYFAAKEKTDAEGKILLEPKKDKFGKIILTKDGSQILVPEREILTEKDGDWVFITKIGFWIFGKKELVRAHYSLCSEIGESIWIKSPNLVPIGDYYYPTQQWQDDIIRVFTQHKAEVLIETYEEFLDLLAHVTNMSLGSDPTLQKIMIAQSEAISSRSAGALIRN